MPVERHPVSWSQFCGLLEIDPARFVGVEVNRVTRTVQLLMEPEYGTDHRRVPAVEHRQEERQ